MDEKLCIISIFCVYLYKMTDNGSIISSLVIIAHASILAGRFRACMEICLNGYESRKVEL